MSLRPLRDFIVVSINKPEETTPSGLIIRPLTVDEKIVTGIVLATGTGHLTTTGHVTPLEVSPGDTILFNKQMAVEIRHQGETVFLLREEHILSAVN